MRKFLKVSSTLFLLGIVFLASAQSVAAISCSDPAFGYSINPQFSEKIYPRLDYKDLGFTINGLKVGGNYRLSYRALSDCGQSFTVNTGESSALVTLPNSGNSCANIFDANRTQLKTTSLELTTPNGQCDFPSVEVAQLGSHLTLDAHLSQQGKRGCFDARSEININISNVRVNAPLSKQHGQAYDDYLRIELAGGGVTGNDRTVRIRNGEVASEDLEGVSLPIDVSAGEEFWVKVYYNATRDNSRDSDHELASLSYVLKDACSPEERDAPPPAGTSTGSGTGTGTSQTIDTPAYELCDQIPDTAEDPSGQKAKDLCTACVGSGSEQFGQSGGIWTSLGCLPKEPQSLLRSLITIALGIAGGIALLMILSGAFMYSTSSGDAKRTTDARETITSAVIGLVFIIFSVTILQFIGVTILQIPGFG